MNGEDQVRRLLGQGAPFAEIVKRTGVGLLQVEILARKAGIADPGVAADAPVAVPRLARPAPAPTPRRSTPTAAVGPDDRVSAALAAVVKGHDLARALADRTDVPSRANTKILVAVRALSAAVDLVKADAGNQLLRAEIDDLKRQLAAKQSELRGKTPTPVQRPEKRDYRAIRVWATEHGHDVKPTGKLPAALVDAYDAWQAQTAQAAS